MDKFQAAVVCALQEHGQLFGRKLKEAIGYTGSGPSFYLQMAKLEQADVVVGKTVRFEMQGTELKGRAYQLK